MSNRLDQEANLRGFLNGKEVLPFRTGNGYNKFDGKKLDELTIEFYSLKSKEDCKALIDFLTIHQHCFSNQNP